MGKLVATVFFLLFFGTGCLFVFFIVREVALGLEHALSDLVDRQAIELMWSELEAAGKATELRRIMRGLTAVRR